LVRETISFHPEDVTVINNASHIQWNFLEVITLWYWNIDIRKRNTHRLKLNT